VVTDATGGSSLQAHEAALRAMHYLQRDCLVNTHDVLAWFAALRAVEALA
jgi:biuret amidohydrolase